MTTFHEMSSMSPAGQESGPLYPSPTPSEPPSHVRSSLPQIFHPSTPQEAIQAIHQAAAILETLATEGTTDRRRFTLLYRAMRLQREGLAIIAASLASEVSDTRAA